MTQLSDILANRNAYKDININALMATWMITRNYLHKPRWTNIASWKLMVFKPGKIDGFSMALPEGTTLEPIDLCLKHITLVTISLHQIFPSELLFPTTFSGRGIFGWHPLVKPLFLHRVFCRLDPFEDVWHWLDVWQSSTNVWCLVVKCYTPPKN